MNTHNPFFAPRWWPNPLVPGRDLLAWRKVRQNDAVRITSNPVQAEAGGHSLATHYFDASPAVAPRAIDLVLHRFENGLWAGGVVGFWRADGGYTNVAGVPSDQVTWMWFHPVQITRAWRGGKLL